MPLPEQALDLLAPNTDSEESLRRLYDVRDRFIPFIGAGLSIPHGYPTWAELLLGLCPDDTVRAKVEDHLNAYRYEEAAEEVWDSVAPRVFREGLANRLAPLPTPAAGAAALLRELSPRPILTTNLDPLIEVVFKDAIPVVRPSDSYSATALQLGKPALLKIHGDYRDKHPVLTLTEYVRAYGHQDPSQLNFDLPLPKLLEQAMLAGPLLFLGCSLNTDRTLRVLTEVTERRAGLQHFAFLSAAEFGRRDQLIKWKINPIFFPKGEYDKIEKLLALFARETTVQPATEPAQAARQRLRSTILERCGTIKILDMQRPIDLAAVYTDVKILETSARNDRGPMEDPAEEGSETSDIPKTSQRRISGRKAVEDYPRLLIYGKPGAGKTTFLKHLAYECIEGRLLPDRVPLFVALRAFADRGGRNLQAWLRTEYQLDDTCLAEHAFVLLDGLDEVNDFSRVRSAIDEFVHQHSSIPIVMTYRIAASEYNFTSFTDVEMADFDKAQIRAFSRNWFTARGKATQAEVFLQRLADNPGLNELASKPLLLTFFCLVFEDGGDLSGSRSQLYEDGLNVLTKKWDASRDIQRRRSLSLEQLTGLLEELAYSNFALPERRIILPEDELDRQIAAFLSERGTAAQPEAEEVRRDLVSKLGLLDLRAYRAYSFSHLTFQEFLTARHLSRNPALIPVQAERLADERWREVWLLLANQLDPDAVLTELQRMVNASIGGDESLQRFLTWVERKANNGPSVIRQPARQALYVWSATSGLARAVDLALALDHGLGRNLYLDRALDVAPILAQDRHLGLDLKLAFALELAHDLARHFELSIDRIRASELSLQLALTLAVACDHARAVTPEMAPALAALSAHQTETLHQARARSEDLRQLMIQHRDIGHDWQFTPDQIQNLNKYLAASHTLVLCLDEARNLKQTTRDTIELNILRPTPRST